jgi:Ca2+-binding EF-hand superfamily protein
MTRVKRSLIFSGGLSALVIVCGLSQARGNPGPTKRGEAEAKFRELDKDKSGFLERAEFPGDDPLFRRADRDGDEKLSFDEALQLLIETEVEKVFMTFDQDRDGVIRIEEVTDERHRANFMAVDKDADGQLTAEEVLAAIRAQFQGDPPGSLENKRRHFSRKEERWHRYSSATYPDMRLPHALPPLLFAEKFQTFISERALRRRRSRAFMTLPRALRAFGFVPWGPSRRALRFLRARSGTITTGSTNKIRRSSSSRASSTAKISARSRAVAWP